MQESWDNIKKKRVETPARLIEFFREIELVCRKYNLSISHEDGHGGFVIEKLGEHNIDWLKDASINYEE